MDFSEIQERIRLLHSRNRDLIIDIQKETEWKKDKLKFDIIMFLEDVSTSYYRAHIVTTPKLDV